jgi:acetylornithine deacetylase/succinyl-diaminopimelate desuccinylase-like protein
VIDAIDKYNEILESKTSKIPNLERCYMNIALVKGGIAGIWNIFPEKCTMQMELRLVPDYDPDEIIKEIKEVVESLKKQDQDLNAEVRELWRVTGFKVPDDLPVIKILQDNIKAISGADVPTGGLGGFVPLGHFYKEMGIPGVTWNPGVFNECNLHQVDENLRIDQLIDATKVFALTAMKYLGVGN